MDARDARLVDGFDCAAFDGFGCAAFDGFDCAAFGGFDCAAFGVALLACARNAATVAACVAAPMLERHAGRFGDERADRRFEHAANVAAIRNIGQHDADARDEAQS